MTCKSSFYTDGLVNFDAFLSKWQWYQIPRESLMRTKEHVRFLESTSMQMQIMTEINSTWTCSMNRSTVSIFTHVSTIDLLPSAVKKCQFFLHAPAGFTLTATGCQQSLRHTSRLYLSWKTPWFYCRLYVSFSYLQAIFVMRDHTEFVKHVMFLWVIKTITFYDSFVHFTSAENIGFSKIKIYLWYIV